MLFIVACVALCCGNIARSIFKTRGILDYFTPFVTTDLTFHANNHFLLIRLVPQKNEYIRFLNMLRKTVQYWERLPANLFSDEENPSWKFDLSGYCKYRFWIKVMVEYWDDVLCSQHRRNSFSEKREPSFSFETLWVRKISTEYLKASCWLENWKL